MSDGARLTQLRLYINQERAGKPSRQRRHAGSSLEAQEGLRGIQDQIVCVHPCVFGNPREDELPKDEEIVCN